MPSETINAIVRAFVDAVNAQDWDKLDALVAPDFARGDQRLRKIDSMGWSAFR
jgi:hypothetical protein